MTRCRSICEWLHSVLSYRYFLRKMTSMIMGSWLADSHMLGLHERLLIPATGTQLTPMPDQAYSYALCTDNRFIRPSSRITFIGKINIDMAVFSDGLP